MNTPNVKTPHVALNVAVIGAGPVGLALALEASARLPAARITVFDALPADRDVSTDPRALALSLGSVQILERLGVWSAVREVAAPIRRVHVSQQQPGLSLLGLGGDAGLWINAREEGVAQLGAVAHYGAIVAPMRAAWLALCADQPQRHSARWGTKVRALKALPNQPAEIEDEQGVVETFDLAVVAEGGVFADQARRAIQRDYHQTAWVGTVTLEGGEAGTAFERFTPQGPLALLPLPSPAGDKTRRASLVWCVAEDGDDIASLSEAQRLTVLRYLLPPEVGRLVGLSPLKSFALGLNAERQLVQGRSVRIGNAAQTMHPVAGQGLNLGLRDARSLMDALRAKAPTSAGVDAALRQMARERAPDRWLLMGTTDFLARSFTWHVPGLTTVRSLALAGLQHLPLFKSGLARQMMFGRR
ncbi:MAG: FAD-dependent monooxygenase [Leptothrix ochracea]|uniref:FAD-dependent monooxygenase n=1 Tax=Leptothrix ochracea TaxID=735331 RepID=UPI0034E2350A